MANIERFENYERCHYEVNLEVIRQKCKQWREMFEIVEPYVDISATSNKDIYSCLLDLGCGLTNRDRAFLSYVTSPLSVNMASSIIDLSSVSHGAYTSQLKAHEINKISFDSEELLDIIKEDYPEANLFLKISTNSITDEEILSVEESIELLQKAKDSNMKVTGLAIYYSETSNFVALDYLNELFKLCKEKNFLFEQVHFFGTDFVKLVEEEEKRKTFVSTLKSYGSDIVFSADAGIYLLAESYSCSAKIIGKKAKIINGKKQIMYYLDDGVYTSFFCVKLDNVELNPIPIRIKSQSRGDELYQTTIWGPTCDSIDCLGSHFSLPELDIDDWIVFDGVGYQCTTMSTGFNGMSDPDTFVSY
ncbi:hypothetical protein WA158_005492 [Blastocystis sp. Blastoise]